MTGKAKSSVKSFTPSNAPADELARRFKAEFAGFVNFNPTESDKEAYVAWVQNCDVWEAMEVHSAKGRKLTVQMDVRNGGHMAMCMERDIESVNAGRICTSRGKTAGIALTRLLFLISDNFPEDWMKSGLMKGEDAW